MDRLERQQLKEFGQRLEKHSMMLLEEQKEQTKSPEEGVGVDGITLIKEVIEILREDLHWAGLYFVQLSEKED